MKSTTFLLANNANTRVVRSKTVDLKRFGKFKDDEFSSNIAARGEDGVGLYLSLFGEINVASLFFYANFCLSAPLPKFCSNCCSRLHGKLCVLNINSDLLNCLIAWILALYLDYHGLNIDSFGSMSLQSISIISYFRASKRLAIIVLHIIIHLHDSNQEMKNQIFKIFCTT